MRIGILAGVGNTEEVLRKDEQDTLFQAQQIADACRHLDWEAQILPWEERHALKELAPSVVFNLVEAIDGHDSLSWHAAEWLEEEGWRYTGSTAFWLKAAANKRAMRAALMAAGVIMPMEWPDGEGLYVVKSETQHGSLGISAENVVPYKDVPAMIERCSERHGGDWYAEQYIAGREFHVAVLPDGQGGIQLLTMEVGFDWTEDDAPRIFNYSAKWDVESEDFSKVRRYFEFEQKDSHLLRRLKSVSLQCWEAMGATGFARIDFRIDDESHIPYVLEVNLNPGLGTNTELFMAAERAGLSMADIVSSIVKAALQGEPQTGRQR